MFGLTVTSARYLAHLEGEVERLRASSRRVEEEKARLTDRILEINGVHPVSAPAIAAEGERAQSILTSLKGWSEMMATETPIHVKGDEESV